MLTFAFPHEGWDVADAEELGVRGAEVVARRRGLGGDYVPVMTIARHVVAPGNDLTSLADDYGRSFASQVRDAHRVRRVETPAQSLTPGVSQVLKGSLEIEGRETALTQIDGFVGTRQPSGEIATVALTVTCADEQLGVVGPEFGAMLTSLGGAPGPAAS